MRWLVFDTAAEAAAAVATIDARARLVFAENGYTVRSDGAVLGRAAGRDDPAAPTLTWDVPRPRADGRWAVLHPEAHPAGGIPHGTGTLAEHLAAGLGGTIETEAPGWWPAPASAP